MFKLGHKNYNLPKNLPKAKPPFRVAIEIQRLIHQDVIRSDCTPKDRCMLAAAYKDLEMLKLRLRMRPAPKAVDVQEMKARQAKARASQKLASGFSETDGNGASGA